LRTAEMQLGLLDQMVLLGVDENREFGPGPGEIVPVAVAGRIRTRTDQSVQGRALSRYALVQTHSTHSDLVQG